MAMHTFMSPSNHSDCTDVCTSYDDSAGHCVDKDCFMSLHSSTRDGGCSCTLLTQQTVTTLGVVLLFILVVVALVVGWRYRRRRCCGHRRCTTM
jgi:hypothetical protein